MSNLQSAVQEGALSQILNDAIASINYEIQIDKSEKSSIFKQQ